MNFPLESMFILLQFCAIALSQVRIESSYTKFKIAGIFPINGEDAKAAFMAAANYFNKKSDTISLEAIPLTVDTTDRYVVQKAVCDLISENNDDDYGNNLVAIFGPNSPETVGLVSSICKRLQIPHFTALWQPIDVDFDRNGSFTRNLFPHPKLYSTALYQIVRSFHWKKFSFVYDSDDALMRLQQIFPITYDKDYAGRIQMQKVRFHRLPDDEKNILVMLKNITKSIVTSIVMDCSLENTKTLLNSTHRLNMNTSYNHYFIANYDAPQTIDLKSLVNFKSNVTTIRLYTPNDNRNQEYRYTSLYNPINSPYNPINYPTTEAAMIGDAVMILANALVEKETFKLEFKAKPIECHRFRSDMEENSSGQAILDNIDNIAVNGTTGPIHFNQDGSRDSFYIEVINSPINPNEDVRILAKYQCPSINNSNCDPKNTNLDSTDNIEYIFNSTSEEVISSIKGRNVKVIMKLGDPYLMLKKIFVNNNTGDMNDKSKYEGFSIDLFNNISVKAGFTYDIIVKQANDPIGKDDVEKGGWTGIIRDLINFKGDFAISDIVINQERKKVIDFSISFKTLGVSILYTKPPTIPPGIFSFMKPYSTDVWLFTGIAILFVCIIEWLLAKIAEIDWENPHPANEDPPELKNIWNMHNCIWLTIASFMQQGCDILPKGVPPRLVAVVWWFFGLIVTESYKASLAASLTQVSFVKHFQNIEELSKQSEIRYGLVQNGATAQLFSNTNDSMYQKMWHKMLKETPSVFVETSGDGIIMVMNSNGKYAFFAETTVIDYYTHRDCKLIQVGDRLDTKEYGIGMPMHSTYRQEINREIMKLKENGELKDMLQKWWKPEKDEKGEPYECPDNKASAGTKAMDLGNVGGVFIVLVVGISISLFLGFLEFLWAVRKTSIQCKITPREAFRRELDFNLRVWKLRKSLANSSEQNSLSDSSNEEINLQAMRNSEENRSKSHDD